MSSSPTDLPSPLLIARGLRVCETLKEWPEAVLAHVAKGSRLARYERSEQVLAHNPRQRDLLVVVSGSVEMSGINSGGARFVLARVGPGVILNLVRLIPGLESSYYCHALAPSLLVHVPANHLRAVLDAYPILWRDMTMLALARQQESILTLQRKGFRSLDQSVAQALLRLLGNHDEPLSEADPITLRVSQADLAAMVSVSRQTINKELRRLTERGMLDVSYGELRILRPKALLQLAESGLAQ